MVFVVNFLKMKSIDWSHVNPMNLTDLLSPIENKDPNPTSSRKAILWGQDDLLARAIETFLEGKKTLQVVRIFAEQGIDFLVKQVDMLCPAVVILYLGNRAFDEHLPMQVIQSQPELKVVVVSLENNLIRVFQKQNLMIHEASDLLSIIEN